MAVVMAAVTMPWYIMMVIAVFVLTSVLFFVTLLVTFFSVFFRLVSFGAMFSELVRNVTILRRTPRFSQAAGYLPYAAVEAHVVVIVKIQAGATNNDIGAKASIKL